jgi:hypothetical protein
LKVELRGVKAPGTADPARSRYATVACCAGERLDVDPQAGRRLRRREQLTDRSSLCIEVRMQTRCKHAQLLVGEVRQESAGERIERTDSGVIVGSS